MRRILVTGASGLVGKHLLPLLKAQGLETRVLSTNKNIADAANGIYYWDPKNGYIDKASLDNIDAIIHLAGCGIVDHKWTTSYKKEIIDSRVHSAELLLEKLKEQNIHLKKFISAGAIGYYPDPARELQTEDSESGNTFLSEVCRQWEGAAKAFEKENIPTVILRTGIVLAREAGFLKAMLKTAGLGIIPTTGQRSNLLSWIDIEDLARAYVYALRPEITGVFNAVSPYPATQIEMARTAAMALGKRFAWHPDVPDLYVRMLLGERAVMAYTDQNVSGNKLLSSGFIFKHPDINGSLNHLLGSAV